MAQKLKSTKGFQKVDIKGLLKAKWNYKYDDKQKAESLRKNIERNGQIENIVVRELTPGRFEIVNGNHRLDAFLALGFKDVQAFNLGKISLSAAKRVAIELNETRFPTDQISLAETIGEIVKEFGIADLGSLPFTNEEITGMGYLLKFNWPEDESEGTQLDGKAYSVVGLRYPAGGNKVNIMTLSAKDVLYEAPDAPIECAEESRAYVEKLRERVKADLADWDKAGV